MYLKSINTALPDRPNLPTLISLPMDRQIPQVSASSSRPRTIRPAAPVNRVHEARMLNVESRLGVVEAFLSAAPRSSGRRRVIHRSATINVSNLSDLPISLRLICLIN